MTDSLRILIKELIGLVQHPSIKPKSKDSSEENPEGEENSEEEMPS